MVVTTKQADDIGMIENKVWSFKYNIIPISNTFIQMIIQMEWWYILKF